jgi:hypothetical protein
VTGYAPIPVLPVSYTWADGEIIPVPYLRASVSAAAQLLSAPPAFIGYEQNTAQPIANATWGGVDIDTEAWDSVNGHNFTYLNQYFAQFPGFYLAEYAGGIDYDGGTGIASAGIGFSSAGGAVTWYGGGAVLNGNTSGRFATPSAAKILQLVNTGPIGDASADVVYPGAWQSSGAAQNTWIDTAAGQYPQFQMTWLAALAGTAGLPVPANPAWPAPPDYITSAFMNTNVTDAIAFLTYPPITEATYTTGTATCPSVSTLPTVGTTVPLNSATWDTYSAFGTGTHTWTAPAAGVYALYGQAALTGQSTSSSMAAGLTVTSANYNSGTQVTLWTGAQSMNTSGPNVSVIRRRLRLNAGDTVLLAAAQHDTGGNAATMQAGQWASRMHAIWRAA